MATSSGANRALVPYWILAVSLSLTAAAGLYAARTARSHDRLRFDYVADRVRSSIDNRLDSYLAMLYGGAGLFAASEDVRFGEFHAYAERLELPRRYPGIQGIGFSRVIEPGERRVIADGMAPFVPGFHYWPEQPPGATIHAILFLEPLDRRNRVAIGFDMFSDPTRREAMSRACETAAAAATGRVRLVQEIDSDQQAGFLIYVPLYRGGGIPGTVEERRRQLIGFVYSPFRASDLLRGIFGEQESQDFTFEVYDGAIGPSNLLHRAPKTPSGLRFVTTRTTKVAGRDWSIVVHSTGGPDRATRRLTVPLVIAGGVVLSLLLFWVTRAQVAARAAAERNAEHLRSSEEALRAANRSKDEFLAIVSHELRTPLNAIVGWAAMLRRGQVSPERQPHAIAVIERNAQAQSALIEDLLDISRAVAGRLRLELAAVDVGATVRAAVDAVGPLAAATGVSVRSQISPSLGMVRADPARLQQIVQNLLTNGIKFSKRGGDVRVDATRDTRAITIRVADDGIGIEREFLPLVFDRFRQADTSTTRKHSGLGLGLAIARHLVELHGGAITAASDGVNRGSVFTVTLPLGDRLPERQAT